MPSYVDYLEYIRFASIHPQALYVYLVKNFGISLETAKKAVSGMKKMGLIHDTGDLVVLTDEGRKLCYEAELHRTGTVKI